MKRIIITIAALILIWLIGLFWVVDCEAEECYLNDEIKALCTKYGEINDIDENLLKAFIEVESQGQADAVSANGQYIGLMQLNKDTFTGDLKDSENNIRQGAEYLNRLRASNDGNMMVAISYYSGESGTIGFYSRKVLNRYFELYCLSIGQEERNI